MLQYVMLEKDVLKEVLKALTYYHKVAWVHRNNVVATKVGGRFMSAGLGVGSPDVVGFTTTGRFIAIECKAPGKGPTPTQSAWLEQAIRSGCAAGVARCAQDAIDIIDQSAMLDRR